VQINLLVGRQVASFSDGSIQYLNLADRLYQLPLGVVAIAIGVVLLPDLSRRLRANDHAGGRDAYNRAFEFALLLTLPAAAALIAIPGPLVSTLFEHGRFGAEDARATALAVMIYGFGLPAFVIQKVLQPVYFARGDTRTPFRYALVSMVVNAALAFGLMAWLGYLAAAVGTSIASWGMVYQLWRGSRSMGDAARADERLLKRGKRIVVATFAMAVPLWFAGQALAPVFEAGGWGRVGALALLVIGAIVVYFGVGHLIGALKIGDLKRATKRS
jgi:putative peptidoglycan lipid II flippase